MLTVGASPSLNCWWSSLSERVPTFNKYMKKTRNLFTLATKSTQLTADCTVFSEKTSVVLFINWAGRKLSWACRPRSLLLAGLGLFVAATASGLDYSALMRSADSARAARYEVFRGFQIKGICGATRLDLAAAYVANTVISKSLYLNVNVIPKS